MANDQHHDPVVKALLRSGWRSALLIQTLLTTLFGSREEIPRVFFAGARSGNVGGPLVKVKRLKAFFPEHKWRYNVVYALSNAPYLPTAALRWIRRRRIPIVLNQNGVFYPGWYPAGWERMNDVMSGAYHLADHVFWQSEFCRKAADRFLGVRSGPGEVLFNAIDTQHFTPASGASESKDAFVFLVTGKIDTHIAYRLESTISGLAFARRQGLNAHLQVAGWVADGARNAAIALAKQLGVENEITFSGTYTQEQAPNIYRSADAYVMTKYLDPCPNTVLEAMSCGLPVLYSASGGVPELVGLDAGVGLSVPEDWESIHTPDAQAIGEGMLRIAESFETMRLAARERAVARFEITHWIDRHREVFEKLLAERKQ